MYNAYWCVCVFAVLNWDKGKQSKEQRQRNEERGREKAKAKGKPKHFRLITNAQMMRA